MDTKNPEPGTRNPEQINKVPRPPSPANLRIAGMALENGVLFHTSRFWTMAVRSPDGGIRLVSGDKVKLGRYSLIRKIPLLRGLVSLAETAMVLPDAHAHGGRLPLLERSPRVMASLLVSLVGTMMVKNPKKRLSPVAEELVISALALVPSLVALRKTSAIQYHAAEHKSINAYETSGALDEKSAHNAVAGHRRCGSNAVGPALAMMTLGNTLTRRILGRQSSVARLGVVLLSLSGAMEAVQWASRNSHSRWAKALTVPGGGLQHLFTTGEPTEDQLEVGLTALKELLRLEGALGEG